MRIGFVASTSWPIFGGMEKYLEEVAVALASRGHDVSVTCRFAEHRPADMQGLLRENERPRTIERESHSVSVIAAGPLGRLLMRPCYRLHFYSATQALAGLLFRRALLASIRKTLDGVDVIHYSGTGRELLGFAAAALAKKQNVPFVITPHIHIDSWGDGELDFGLYSRADALIAITETERRHMIDNGIDSDRIRVIGHGLTIDGSGNADRFRNSRGIQGQIVLFLGRQNRHKGFERLLLAAAEVWKRLPETHFVFAGPSDASYRPDETVSRVLESPRVTDLGAVTDQVKEDAIAACDVFCVPSEAEAFGLVYLEAGYYGKPVVALNIPTLQELIAANGSGLLVKDDPVQLGAALLKLLHSPELRQKLGNEGRRLASAASWDVVAQALEDTYESVVNRKTEPGG